MSQLFSIDDIKITHQKLYNMALKDIPEYLRDVSKSASSEILLNVKEQLSKIDEFKNYLDDLKSLIKNIKLAAEQTESFEDYNWLMDAATKWQTIYSGTLNIPINIKMPLPKRNLILPRLGLSPLPGGQLFTEEEIQIEKELNRRAAQTLHYRWIESGVWPSDEEIVKAHYWAGRSFVVDILEGYINFPSRIKKNSYWRLAGMWLKEAKEYMAYMYTLAQHTNPMESHPELDRQYYEEICKHLRELLVVQKKGLISEFDVPKSYIEEFYLTDGKLDLSKPEASKLIDIKAHRFAEKILDSGGKPDDFKNRIDAETYSRMFYENIIPAVLESNQGKAKEKTLVVLKALQFCESESAKKHYHVVNCLEAALAIYFLNGQFIQELWGEFANQPPPDSCVESVVDIESFPDTFKIPIECEGAFFHWDQKISFKGVMNKEQEALLCAQVQDEQQKKSIENLYLKSRTVHRETTF